MTTSFIVAARRALIPVAVVTALTLTACASSHPTGAVAYTSKGNVSNVAATTTTIKASTTVSRASATMLATKQAAQLRSAVHAFWDLYLRLGRRTGPFDGIGTRTALEGRTSGPELNRLLAYFSSDAASGYVVRGTISVAPRVESATGTTARVSDCYDDRTGLYRVGDNQRVDSDNPLRHRVLMTFALARNVWKVTTITDEGDGCHAA
jgi:hypothetical protein